MNVDVDEPGAGDETARLDHLCVLQLFGRKAGHESAVGDEKIALGIALGGRVDDAGVGDPEESHEGKHKLQTSKSQIPSSREAAKAETMQPPVAGLHFFMGCLSIGISLRIGPWGLGFIL